MKPSLTIMTFCTVLNKIEPYKPSLKGAKSPHIQSVCKMWTTFSDIYCRRVFKQESHPSLRFNREQREQRNQNNGTYEIDCPKTKKNTLQVLKPEMKPVSWFTGELQSRISQITFSNAQLNSYCTHVALFYCSPPGNLQ